MQILAPLRLKLRPADALGAHEWAFVHFVVCLVLVAARLGLAVSLWRPGFSALTWDDFTRVLIARDWAASPFVVLPDLVWLPLHSWVMGCIFAVFGEAFASSPMALAAITNTAALVIAAALVARASYDLFEDGVGAVLVFAFALFAPWGVYLSLSGLSEPFYYLAVAGVVRALAAFLRRPALMPVALGGLAVAAAAAIRYEGWLLAISWLVVVFSSKPLWGGRGSRAWMSVVIAGLPGLVPLSWLLLNAARTGNPFTFMKTAGRMFEQAYGTELFESFATRALYYPTALFQSEPLFMPVMVVLAVWGAFSSRRARSLTVLLGLQFVAFYAPSLFSRTLGAFTERFMFVYIFGLSPFLAQVPEIVRRVQTRRVRWAVVGLGLVIATAEFGYRIPRTPEEWSFSPDFLEMSSAVVQASEQLPKPIRVVMGPQSEYDPGFFGILLGDRAQLKEAGAAPTPGPDDDYDLWIEGRQERVAVERTSPGAVFGRYHLYGPVAAKLQPRQGLMRGWHWISEDGSDRLVPETSMLAFEFIKDNPLAGEKTMLVLQLSRTAATQQVSFEVRAPYGHGFQRGRIRYTVSVDGVEVLDDDIGSPSRWQIAKGIVGPGEGAATIVISTTAQPGIEDWGWGRNSTVLVRRFAVREL